MMLVASRVLLAVMAVMLVACDQGPETLAPNSLETKQKNATAGLIADSDPVLVRVGESEVRQSQMTVLLQRLPNAETDLVTDDTRQKVLESLVQIRTLAMAAEQQLAEQEQRLLDAKVQAFRDELLAQKYLQMNMAPEPVTSAMVMNYYNEHLDEFTEKGKVRFQTLTTTKDLDDSVRKKVLQAFAAAKNDDDWKAYASKVTAQGLAVKYKAAQMVPKQLPDSIKLQVEQLAVGAVSDLIYGEQIEIVKLIAREPDRIQPIASVSAKIRKKLAPMQLKKALKLAAEQVMEKTEIEYISQSE